MHCASCVFKIERALKSVKGVRTVSVNFANQKAYVEHDDVPFSTLRDAVHKAGYKVV